MLKIQSTTNDLSNIILENYKKETILISGIKTIGKAGAMQDILEEIGFKSKATINGLSFTHFVIPKGETVGYWSLIDTKNNNIFFIDLENDTSSIPLDLED